METSVALMSETGLATNSNYLQPTGFKLVIDRTSYPNLEFFAQSVTHPSIMLPAVETSYRNLATVPMPGDKLDYGELTANVMMDEEMRSYTEVYQWLQRIIEDNVSAKISRDVTRSHFADVTVSVLSSHNNQVKQIRYIDAMPTMLGDVQFESTTNDVQYITFPITFRFSYFKLV